MKSKKGEIPFIAKAITIIIMGIIIWAIASGKIGKAADSLFGFTEEKSEVEVEIDKEKAEREDEVQQENRLKAIEVFNEFETKIKACLNQNNFDGRCASCGVVDLDPEKLRGYSLILTRGTNGENFLELYDSNGNLVYPEDGPLEIGNFFAIPKELWDDVGGNVYERLEGVVDYRYISYFIKISSNKMEIQKPKLEDRDETKTIEYDLENDKIYFKRPELPDKLKEIEPDDEGIYKYYNKLEIETPIWYRYSNTEEIWQWTPCDPLTSDCWMTVERIKVRNDDECGNYKGSADLARKNQNLITELVTYNPIPPTKLPDCPYSCLDAWRCIEHYDGCMSGYHCSDGCCCATSGETTPAECISEVEEDDQVIVITT